MGTLVYSFEEPPGLVTDILGHSCARITWVGYIPGHTCHLTARRFTSSHLCATWVADLGALASNCELTDLLATWVAATGREGGMPPDTSHC